MLNKSYSTEIQANDSKIWNALWDLNNYKKWTSAFCEGSYAVTDDWKEGTRVHFLTPDGNGMYSDIIENSPNKKMAFKHIGDIKDFKEIELDEEQNAWTGAKEIYELEQLKDNLFQLKITVDIYEKFFNFFESTFPKALENIKEIAEKK